MQQFKMLSAKVDPKDAEEFESKVGKRNVSLAIRELIKQFNAGSIKITLVRTLGG